MPAPGYILALLLTAGLTLATWLQPVAANWNGSRAKSGSLLNIIMGDARRMFATHFFMKADVYLHSGYYPSIFDQGLTNEAHIAEQASTDPHAGHSHDEHHHDEHGDEMEPDEHAGHEHEYIKPSRDWIETFGRNFFNTEHTELSGAGANEILPWLRISVELDPQRIDSYTVASFWLRNTMNRPHDAEEFLREGQRANPDSFEIIFELGQLYRDNYKDTAHARNLFLLAKRKLDAQPGDPDLQMMRRIDIALSRIEEKEGNIPEAIRYIKELHDAFPPDHEAARKELEKQIQELTQKLAK